MCDYAMGVEVAFGVITAYVPIRLESEANRHEHWAAKHRRNKHNSDMIRLTLRNGLHQIEMPCTISMVRIAPRTLDDDNLIAALKYVRDTIADMITPGLAPGRADGLEGITWQYKQEKKTKTYGLKIVLSQTRT